MLSSRSVTTVVVIQLILGFVAVLLAAFSAVCFTAEFGYGVVWWSFGWTMVMACLRWFANDFQRSVVEQTIHLAFEFFAAVSWLVATGVLVALNIRLNKLKKDYDYYVDNNYQLTSELQSHQFNAVGMGGLYCSYTLNAVTGIIFCLFALSTLDGIRFLRRSRRHSKNAFEKEYKYDEMSSQQNMVQKTASHAA